VTKLHAIDLPALHCSLDPMLGDYYQEMYPALHLVESGYHGGMDPDGVPLVRYGDQGSFHNAVITSQYALANMIAIGRGEAARATVTRVLLDWLVTAQATSGRLAGAWVMEHDNAKYPWLRSPWTSAMASGNSISALLRGWQLFGDARYRSAAEAAYVALHEPRTEMAIFDGDDLWYEEYPGDPPLHVLNGHIYTLLGVVDWARVTGDTEADARWRRAVATTLAHLDGFDLGFWSAYDLRWREPVSLHYQRNVHVPQLRILAALTGEQRFTAVADRWERQFSSLASRMRWHAALRIHGQRKRREARAAARSNTPAIELRPFPYPYRAALALCNDADSMTVDQYRRMRRYLTTDAETEWGPGLALTTGGSFFMYSSPDSPNTFTVFDRLSDTITDDGEFILDCVSSGELDVLHTYGCFTDPKDFARPLAERALATLRDRAITIETWVNHGPPTNVQCIGLHHGWQGDLPGSPAYHADLLIDHGVRWIWTGDEIADRIAHDPAHPAQRRDRGRRLVEPYVLRDGQHSRCFYRYGGLNGRTPVLDDLPTQLSAANLDELVATGGYTVIYQHLAVRRLRPGYGTQAYGPVDDRWFRPEELEVLRDLARRFHDGDLWVVPTTRLLHYRDTHEALRWRAHRDADGDVIHIGSGGDVEPDPGGFADLTFLCERPEATRVYVETTHGLHRVESVRANPPDEQGRLSITVWPSGQGRSGG
jgi:D-glucuronyl C5-epimerase C-terminus